MTVKNGKENSRERIINIPTCSKSSKTAAKPAN
jgi:hypothetical protein